MSAHTPGPWESGLLVDDQGEPMRGDRLKAYVTDTVARSTGEDFYVVVVQKGDGAYDVCHAGNGEDSKANARLIAAAPDLLAVVRDFREKLATYTAVYPGDKQLRRLLEASDVAIAKASSS